MASREFDETIWSPSGVGLLAELRDLIAYRELIKNLVRRDLEVRYKNSILGFLWSLLNPLFMMGILSVVFSVVFGQSGDVENFPAFLLVGLIPWNFCSTALSQAVSSVLDNAALIRKIYFPREVLPLSVVLANFVHFLLALLVLILILIPLGVRPTALVILLPLLSLIQLILMAGIALIVSCVNVFYRDMGVALDVLLQGWFFLTPILYHHRVLPVALQKPAMANPLASIIAAYRDVLIRGRLPDLHFALGALLTSTLIFVSGYLLFRRYSPGFPEEI